SRRCRCRPASPGARRSSRTAPPRTSTGPAWPPTWAIKPVYLARVPAGGIAGAWQFWTGSAWSAREAEAASLMSGVGTAFGVQKTCGQYVLVTVDGNVPFNPDVVAYTAAAPTG